MSKDSSLRIQKTRDGTFLVVETDSDGETFALAEFNTWIEATDCIAEWVQFDDAWEDSEDCSSEEEI